MQPSHMHTNLGDYLPTRLDFMNQAFIGPQAAYMKSNAALVSHGLLALCSRCVEKVLGNIIRRCLRIRLTSGNESCRRHIRILAIDSSTFTTNLSPSAKSLALVKLVATMRVYGQGSNAFSSSSLSGLQNTAGKGRVGP